MSANGPSLSVFLFLTMPRTGSLFMCRRTSTDRLFHPLLMPSNEPLILFLVPGYHHSVSNVLFSGSMSWRLQPLSLSCSSASADLVCSILDPVLDPVLGPLSWPCPCPWPCVPRVRGRDPLFPDLPCLLTITLSPPIRLMPAFSSWVAMVSVRAPCFDVCLASPRRPPLQLQPHYCSVVTTIASGIPGPLALRHLCSLPPRLPHPHLLSMSTTWWPCLDRKPCSILNPVGPR